MDLPSDRGAPRIGTRHARAARSAERNTMSPLKGSTAGATDIADVAPVAAALVAQLQRLQQQLADSLQGAGAKTPEGKAAIDALRGKISQLEQRISQSDQVSERRQAQLRAGKSEPAASVAANADTVAAAPKSTGTGKIIDVFA
jgi:uncharacterized protein involved in exopolysaccharide biosynthesis